MREETLSMVCICLCLCLHLCVEVGEGELRKVFNFVYYYLPKQLG